MITNVYAIGGYRVRNDILIDNSILWFTGVDWMIVPFSSEGERHNLITAPYENVDFICGDFLVEIRDLAPGDCLYLVSIISQDPLLQTKNTYKIVNLPYKDNGIKGSHFLLQTPLIETPGIQDSFGGLELGVEYSQFELFGIPNNLNGVSLLSTTYTIE